MAIERQAEVDVRAGVEVEVSAEDRDPRSVRRPLTGFGVVCQEVQAAAVGVDGVDLLLPRYGVVDVDDDLFAGAARTRRQRSRTHRCDRGGKNCEMKKPHCSTSPFR
jgi:hypothetical protein